MTQNLRYGHTHGDYTVVLVDGEERGGVRTARLGWRARLILRAIQARHDR